jgi:2-methylisocitrate lyase-like PEP mutase family enzyme
MAIQTQVEKAHYFRGLHQGGHILVLPNVWDVASARLVEEAGARAIATSSAGIAFSLGYADGQYISCPEMVESVRRIARAVDLPVTADFEAGYGKTIEAIVENVRAVMATGAVGINFEDGKGETLPELEEVDVQSDKIRAIREMAASAGVPLVINARTDVFLAGVGEPAGRFNHAVRRANAYRKAGADCLFVPGVIDAETITRLVKAIDGPLNILAGPGCPAIPKLQEMGVARVSVGSKPMCATMGLVQQIARELLEQGTYATLESPVKYAFMNQLFMNDR